MKYDQENAWLLVHVGYILMFNAQMIIYHYRLN